MRAHRMLATALAVLATSLAQPSSVRAHGLDPASLMLREIRPGVMEVAWQMSMLRAPGTDVRPVLPSACRPVGESPTVEERDRVTLRWTVDCGAGALAGTEIRVEDLDAAKINVLLRIERLDGSEALTVLGPGHPSFVVPARAEWWEVVRSYVALGVAHILSGPDHLLFVFGLLLLVPSLRVLAETITAFTIGHSLTLSAAVLHVARVPSRPIEVLIALSVLVLAVELASPDDASTWLRRRPWLMAGAFGLLHGFGFAGALTEAGLPPGDVPLALASFNVGIECGQLMFVAVVVAARAAVVRWAPGIPARTMRPAVYAMGITAAFWSFERLAVWLG
jgi:hydrogenase/urease accessory protein HupE